MKMSFGRIALNLTFGLTLILSTGGIMALFVAYPDSADWSNLPFTALGALGGSSIAALGALAVAETYGDKNRAEIGQRKWETKQALQRQREETYTILAQNYLAQFQSGQAGRVTNLRASASLWSSQEVVAAMAQWNELLNELDQYSTDGSTYTLADEPRRRVQLTISSILAEMRKDLGGSSISNDDMARMIFNDFDSGSA